MGILRHPIRDAPLCRGAVGSVSSLCLAALCIVGPGWVAYAADDFAASYEAHKRNLQAGSDALKKGDLQQAIAAYTKVIEKSPFEATAYLNRGIALFKSKKFKDAEEDFGKALILDPRLTNALAYRGLCREKSGNEKGALEDYTRAIQQQPDDVSLQNNIAWLYATAKDAAVRDNVKALVHASRAAALSKEKNATVLDTLARAYFVNGKAKEAAETEKKALELEPKNEDFKKTFESYEGATTK